MTTRTLSEFQAVLRAQAITCARCGGLKREHDRDGKCMRLERKPRRHGQLDSLR